MFADRSSDPPADRVADDTDRPCPRCGGVRDDERFYGPCASCRDELRATVVGTASELEATAFEPAMHVTPNAVAVKD
jgi:hypothetical protein